MSEVDPIRAEALRLAKASLGWRPSARKLIDTALMFEVYLLGASHRWGGTPSGGPYTLSRIAYGARSPSPAEPETLEGKG